jgi:hypothetical protein
MIVMVAFAQGNDRHKGPCAEDQGEEPNDPVCLESEVRVEPVITKRYGKSAPEEHH